jgi:hypothetical protein
LQYVREDVLFGVLCWWPYSEWPAPTAYGRPSSMSLLLASGDYRIRPVSARLGSRRCIVMENPGADTLWLDAAPPHCVLRREVFNNHTGALAWRCDMDGHTHHGQDLWFPRTFTSQHFDSDAESEESQKRLVIDAKFELTSIRINDEVNDQDFNFVLPPGTVRTNSVGSPEELQPICEGQRDHAAAMTLWAAATAGAPAQPNINKSARSFSWMASWWVVSLLLGIGTGSLLARLRPKRSRILKGAVR